MSLIKLALSGVLWTGIQQFSSQGISFFVSIILARLLLPEEFALIAMLALFLGIGQTLTNSGLSSSLIRTTDPDDEDYSTVFYFNLLVSIFIYLVLWFTAPFVAEFYNQPILINLVRVLSLKIILDAFSMPQKARLTKKMDFKSQMLVNVPALITGSITGVLLAYKGYGVWSLVYMRIAIAFVGSVSFWIHSKWVPLLSFSKEKFKYHFKFGNRLALSGLLDTVFNNIYAVVIGKFYPAAQLGYFSRADSLKQLPVNSLSSILSKVTYPMFADIKDDVVRLKSVYKRVMQMTIFVISPVLFFLAAVATPLFELLFTAKWLPAVPYFRILCLAGILYPIHAYNLSVLNVLGRSDLFFRLEVIKKVILVIVVAASFKFGIYGLLYGSVLTSLFALVVNTYYTDKFIHYSVFQQLTDLLPTIFLALGVAAVVYSLDVFAERLVWSNLARSFVGLSFGGILFLLFSKVIGLNAFTEAMSIIKNRK